MRLQGWWESWILIVRGVSDNVMANWSEREQRNKAVARRTRGTRAARWRRSFASHSPLSRVRSGSLNWIGSNSFVLSFSQLILLVWNCSFSRLIRSIYFSEDGGCVEEHNKGRSERPFWQAALTDERIAWIGAAIAAVDGRKQSKAATLFLSFSFSLYGF